MSWLSSFFHNVEKYVVRPVAPTLITGAAVAGLGALTGGAAFGTASIAADAGALAKAQTGGAALSSGVNPAMGIAGGLGIDGQPSLLNAPQTAGVGGSITDAENYLSAASHNLRTQGVKYGIYIVIILFMLAAFVALLLPDEQTTVNLAGAFAKGAA